jgi:hypothetical protein
MRFTFVLNRPPRTAMIGFKGRKVNVSPGPGDPLGGLAHRYHPETGVGPVPRVQGTDRNLFVFLGDAGVVEYQGENSPAKLAVRFDLGLNFSVIRD